MKRYRWYIMRVHTIALATAMLVFASMAAAQNEGAALSDSDLALFVMINVELQKLAEEYQPALNEAGSDAAKRAALEQEIQKKAEVVLAKNNSTPDGYRQTYQIVNSNPELRAKALQLIQQEREKR